MDTFFKPIRSLERMTNLNAFSFSVNSETKERKGGGTRTPHSLGRHATNSQTGLEKRDPPTRALGSSILVQFNSFLSH